MSSKNPQRTGHVPILPASTEGQTGPEASAAGRLVSASLSRKRHKRTQITPVACQPCQQRKSKCDGARPACSSCAARKRTDCWYNAAGDQRRTASLKQRIRELEQETHDLREALAIATGRNNPGGESATGAELRTRQWQRAQNAQRATHSPLSIQESLNDPDDTDFESQADLTSDLDALEASHDATTLASINPSVHALAATEPGSFATPTSFPADAFPPGFPADSHPYTASGASGAAMMQGWPWTGSADSSWNYDPNAPPGGGGLS